VSTTYANAALPGTDGCVWSILAQIEADATQRAENIRDSRSGLQIVNVTGASYSASV
jgi:hypothetical protein